ncbi:nuclear envelope integral membrane protein 1-like [Plakobranchus ocellatus]|uniref:Nuclear envelope integral membrane protein 1-like n=1 Tax=Plakobranchus ocellatus TaxID=259542 RepID=A0AAV3ZCM4_9GAST|nr:nuclear envelope integral membrane protein 1-like [Plakobranchus ocellatus]
MVSNPVVAGQALCTPPACVQVNLSLNLMQVMVTARNDTAGPDGAAKLCILCYPGVARRWFRLWLHPKMKINLPEGDPLPDIFYGSNVSEVVERSRSAGYLRWPSLWGQLHQQYAFEPFNASCIGVKSTRGYTIDFAVKNPELWFLVYTGIGLLLFFFAPYWSRNKFLHYGTGVSVGVLGSVLIALFIVNRFLPQKVKTLGSVLLVISTSASMFLLQHVTFYINDIFLNHWQAVLGYVLVASVLSFAVMYRYGPVTNPRTLDLVRWSLQVLGLVLVYHGSQIPEMAVVIMVTAFLLYLFPSGFFPWLRKQRMIYFPPRRRLLTKEEFYQEGLVETEKALQELREFCRSPQCNAWKTVSRLNTSNRFGRFMEGEEHITEAESFEHETTCEINPRDVEDSDSSESELSFRMNTR